MILRKKIKAGVLQYVLVVSVIIAIIIFAFISLIFLQQRITIKRQFAKEAILNVQNGFDYLKHKEVPYNKLTILNISENTLAETTILKKHWGVFDLGIVTSIVKNETFEKVALLSTENKTKEAIYLKENNQSLVLVGSTKITGNVSIPKLGIKRGSIAGTSYYGSQLIYGNTKTSANKLPKISNLEYITNFIDNYRDDGFENFELQYNTKTFRSFTEKKLIYESPNPIILEDISLNGNIIVVSNTNIIIKKSTNLEDIILIAPKVIIEKNTTGNFQVLATEMITVNSNCVLNYPTTLVLLENKMLEANSKEKHQILIEKNSEVKGIVLFDSKEKTTNYNSQIIIQDKAIVKGEIYCTKNVELRGSVFGSVYTNNFLAKEAGGIYINHILNGIVNSEKLPQQFAGLQIKNESNTVAKWAH